MAANTPITDTEILSLLAEREGIMCAESQAPGLRLIEQWTRQLTPRQVELIEAFDAAVDRYRDIALADHHDMQIGLGKGLH